MIFPQLDNWEPTRDSLHRAAQVAGEVKRLLVEKQPNALHLSVYAAPRGLTTGPLPSAGEFEVDYGGARILHHGGEGAYAVPIAGHTPASLLHALLGRIPGGLPQGAEVRITDDQIPFSIDPAIAAAYAGAHYQIFTAFARFRARLFGTMTPAVIWPHHFDLSFLWFAGHNPDEHSQPHMNFGFAPFSPGFDQPYVYVYLWPLPDRVTEIPLPAPARWHNEGWTGAVIDYAELRRAAEPEALIEAILGALHRALAPYLMEQRQ